MKYAMAYLVCVMVAVSGCAGGPAASPTTESTSQDHWRHDVSISSELNRTVVVNVTVAETETGTPSVNESFELKPDSSKTFDKVIENDSYRVEVTANGTTRVFTVTGAEPDTLHANHDLWILLDGDGMSRRHLVH